MKRKTPVLLMILDGWGLGVESPSNAVTVARMPNLARLQREYPTTSLTAHGVAVGLPAGQMGNSEVGHLNIGAGRVVYQDLTRINLAIESGTLAANPTLCPAFQRLRQSGAALHLMGLLSDGGVHSHLDHLLALVRIAASQGVAEIFIHCFMDGRDTPPRSGEAYMARLQAGLAALGAGRVATVIGRYYAMDRDNRWERVAEAWRALVAGGGIPAADPEEAVRSAYARGENDEFIRPVVLVDGAGQPVGAVRDNDAILFFNFRADRARELSQVFTQAEFSGFPRGTRPRLADFITLTSYGEDFAQPVVFPPLSMARILGEEVSQHGLRQLRIAETEKYAHVTYFFNGGREEPFPLEERVLIPSPKEVATYDLKPEMSAFLVTEELSRRLAIGEYDLVVLNFANADMVGHSGILAAAVQACEVVDRCVGRLVAEFTALGGVVLITADHGNADIMFDQQTNGPHTAHTCNPVPFVLVGDEYRHCRLRPDGALKDIAPTVMQLLGLAVPAEMEGRSLVVAASAQ